MVGIGAKPYKLRLAFGKEKLIKKCESTQKANQINLSSQINPIVYYSSNNSKENCNVPIAMC